MGRTIKTTAEKLLRMSNPNLSRVLGWALLVFSLLSMSTQFAQTSEISFVYVITLAIGVWLMIRAIGVLEEGETARHLKIKHLQHQVLHASRVHTGKRVMPSRKAISTHIRERLTSEYVLGLIVCLALALSVVSAAFFIPILFIAVTTSLCIYLILLGMMRKSVITLGVAQVIGMALLFNAAQWFGGGATYALEQVFINVLGAVIIIASVFCLGNIPRTHANHIVGRVVIINAFLFYVCAATGLVTTGTLNNLGYALLTFAAAMGPAAAFAWIRFERSSFAKYLATAAVLAVLAFAYLYLSTVAVTLIWFISAVSFFMFGFGLPSYSARIMGLTLLAGTFINYMLLLVPGGERVAGSFWMQESFWLGVLLSIFMLLVAGWYNAILLSGMEAYLRPLLRRSLMLASYAVVTIIIVASASGLTQTVVLALFGAIGALLGVFMRSRWTVLGGSAIALIGLLNFLIIIGGLL